jgi:hypothetical protein
MSATILATDRTGQAIQAVAWGEVAELAFAAGSTLQTAVGVIESDTAVLRLTTDVDCWVRIGSGAGLDANGQTKLPAGAVDYIKLPVGLAQPCVAVRGVVGGGTLNITQCRG